MSTSKMLPNGQVYYTREKRHGMKNKPARRPTKKARRRWRREVRRLGMTPEQYRKYLISHYWFMIRLSGQW